MTSEAIATAQDALRRAFANRSGRLAPRKPDEPDDVYAPAPANAGALQGAPDPGGIVPATFDSAINKFLAALGGRASISSGTRSPERQQQLWEQALKKYGDPEIADNWVARPGTSRHERGLAKDLKYADDATRAEAHRIAEQYGLWFPMSHEPWHVEPISTRRKK